MKKNIYFKLFTLVSLFLFCIIPAFASQINPNSIAKVAVEPIQNSTYTLNLYFNDTYTGKAFLQKVSDGSYVVYIPDTVVNTKKVKLVYKNKYDKKNININLEQKPYKNKENESNYVKISVNMNADYSLKLLSKNINDEKFTLFTDSSINVFSLIILCFGLIVFFILRRISNLVKAPKSPNSYTSFPDSFYNPKVDFSDNINFYRNLNSKPVYETKQNTTKPLKTADKNSFGCFDIPVVSEIEKQNPYNNNPKKQIVKTEKPVIKKQKQTTSPIIYNEAQELDLPAAEELIKKAPEKKEKKAELLSILNITPNKGFYLTTVDDTIALFGFIGESVFLFHRFKDLSQINLQARFYDKNGDNDVYIVRIDTYKAMVEISNDSMKELAVL